MICRPIVETFHVAILIVSHQGCQARTAELLQTRRHTPPVFYFSPNFAPRLWLPDISLDAYTKVLLLPQGQDAGKEQDGFGL